MKFYSQEHPLAQHPIHQAQSRSLEATLVQINYRANGLPVSALEPFLDKSGWMELAKLTIHSVDDYERLILSGSSRRRASPR